MHLINTFLLLVILSMGGTLTAQTVFLEQDGILRVDVTSTDSDLGQWVKRTELAGFIGEDYLEFEGPNFFNAPGNSLLSYTVRITTTGTYEFSWYSRITEADENTEFNDSWMRAPDATRFYALALNGDSRVYPRGTGMTPNPEGSGRDGWFKVYQNRSNEWFWGAFTFDNDRHAIFMDFDEPGDYTIEISGRSTGHAINRFVMVHSSASESEARDRNQPESPRLSTSVRELSVENLEIWPNPAPTFIGVTAPDKLTAGTYAVDIISVNGQVASKGNHHLYPGQTTRIPLENLPSGTYLLRLEVDGVTYQAKFIH